MVYAMVRVVFYAKFPAESSFSKVYKFNKLRLET